MHIKENRRGHQYKGTEVEILKNSRKKKEKNMSGYTMGYTFLSFKKVTLSLQLFRKKNFFVVLYLFKVVAYYIEAVLELASL